MNAHTIEDLNDLCRSWWWINCTFYTLVDWIEKHNRVVLESNEQRVWIIIKAIIATTKAFTHSLDLLFGDVIRRGQVTDQANLDEALEDHCINLVIDELDIHY